MQLEKIYLFEGLNPELITRLTSQAISRRYEAGSMLFMAGEQPRHLIWLEEGRVRVYKNDDRGNEVTLHHFGSGNLIAEMAALERVPYPASAVCESDAQLVLIALEPFEREFLHDPAIAGMMIRSLCRKIRHLELALKRSGGGDAISRVAALLRESPQLFKTLKQHEIASLLGMTPETLSRTLKKLRSDGVIAKNGRGFEILKAEQLADLTS